MPRRFSGNTKETVYNIVSKTGSTAGIYNQLYGGFYQGFFKLHGYDYEVFPNRTNKGWSVEMILRPRFEDQYSPTIYQTTLNDVYPENTNTFFYFGTRAENKFYHHASGSPISDSGYTRVTETLVNCFKTCACSNSGSTNSRCVEAYEPLVYKPQHGTNCNCGCNANTTSVPNPDKDPLYDTMSNSFSIKLSGDPKNPKICVKVLKFTGGCEVTGTCPTTGITYNTGYTITEYCSTNKIYDYCEQFGPNFLNKEHWFLVDCIWERNSYFDDCDLYYKGGLALISKNYYVDSLSDNTVNLIEPPLTHSGSSAPEKIDVINLNEKWLTEKNHRLGSLKIFVNGKLFFVINGFEEIIPRALNTEKEKQLGVPFNISWGGGTQGLRESLTLDDCPTSLTGLTYQQDPEVMPNETLSGTSLSALTTNILLEPTFGGTFDGGISQFRMYTKPLSYPEIKHNYNILKNKFGLFDPSCPDCFSQELYNDITGTLDQYTVTLTSSLYFNSGFTGSYQSINGGNRVPLTGTTFNLTQNMFPLYGDGTYYLYFENIDQTLPVNVASPINDAILVSLGPGQPPDFLIVAPGVPLLFD